MVSCHLPTDAPGAPSTAPAGRCVLVATPRPLHLRTGTPLLRARTSRRSNGLFRATGSAKGTQRLLQSQARRGDAAPSLLSALNPSGNTSLMGKTVRVCRGSGAAFACVPVGLWGVDGPTFPMHSQ